jgi:hypothetical protein
VYVNHQRQPHANGPPGCIQGCWSLQLRCHLQTQPAHLLHLSPSRHLEANFRPCPARTPPHADQQSMVSHPIALVYAGAYNATCATSASAHKIQRLQGLPHPQHALTQAILGLRWVLVNPPEACSQSYPQPCRTTLFDLTWQKRDSNPLRGGWNHTSTLLLAIPA